MKKRIFQTILIVTGTLIFFSGKAFAQRDTTKLKQEVEVTKAYRPEVSSAVKINDIPKVVNESTETPTFDYSIFSKPVMTNIEMTPVAAAKMVGEPRPQLGMGLLKLGVGNYLTPYGEFFFNSKPDKNSTFGMHFNHLSSSGKISLLNGDKVKAPESTNGAEIFGQKFFGSATLTGSLGYDRKAFSYYGYTGDLLSAEEKAQMVPWIGQKQYLSKGTLSFDLKSDSHSMSDMTYDFGLNFHYLTSKTGQSESQTVITGDLSKKFDTMLGLLNFSVTSYSADSIWNRVDNTFGKKQQLLIGANPSVKWAGDQASFQIGLNSTLVFDHDVPMSVKIWPKIKAQWSPVADALTLYAGIDGHLQHNTYSAITYENPYVDPYHDVANTNFKYILSGGLKGRIGSKTNFVTGATYSVVNDQHFYFLESRSFYDLRATDRYLNNTFSWVYDDVNVLKLTGELLHSVSDNISVHLVGNYYNYHLKTLTTPWQMPNFDLTLSGSYKPSDSPLKFTAEVYLIGKRTALILDNPGNVTPMPFYTASTLPETTRLTIPMNPIVDLNAGLEYRISKPLSFFAKANNFGFQKYEQWLGYTSKSLNWLAGISYSF